MSDEDQLRKDAQRADRAKHLLENELLKEAFDSLTSAYIQHWASTKFDDVTGREKLFLAANVVGKVREHLMNIISHGTVSKAALEEIAQARS